jgi:hypothetical protein
MNDPFTVTVTQTGRGGSIEYVEGDGRLRFDWEFGGSGAVALIFVPTPPQWEAGPPWSRGRREQILRRITDAVIRQQAPSCVAEFEGDGIINIRRLSAPTECSATTRSANC